MTDVAIRMTQSEFNAQYPDYSVRLEVRGGLNDIVGRKVVIAREMGCCERIGKLIACCFYSLACCFHHIACCCGNPSKEEDKAEITQLEGCIGTSRGVTCIIEDSEKTKQMQDDDDEALGINRHYSATLREYVQREMKKGTKIYSCSAQPMRFFLPVIGPKSHSSFAIFILNQATTYCFVPISNDLDRPLQGEALHRKADEMCATYVEEVS